MTCAHISRTPPRARRALAARAGAIEVAAPQRSDAARSGSRAASRINAASRAGLSAGWFFGMLRARPSRPRTASAGSQVSRCRASTSAARPVKRVRARAGSLASRQVSASSRRRRNFSRPLPACWISRAARRRASSRLLPANSALSWACSAPGGLAATTGTVNTAGAAAAAGELGALVAALVAAPPPDRPPSTSDAIHARVASSASGAPSRSLNSSTFGRRFSRAPSSASSARRPISWSPPSCCRASALWRWRSSA